MPSNILLQIPIPGNRRGIGLRIRLSKLLASNLNSNMLLNNAYKGPKGNTPTKNVTTPYWVTAEIVMYILIM